MDQTSQVEEQPMVSFLVGEQPEGSSQVEEQLVVSFLVEAQATNNVWRSP